MAEKVKTKRLKIRKSAPVEKPATDIYTFENIRRDDFTYIDKTAIILPLIDKSQGRQFFIARPRRFGKSLCVSTLHAIFEGKKQLFEGLAIEKKWNWREKYPVLHLDMGSCQAQTVKELWQKIDNQLQREAKRNNVSLNPIGTTADRFMSLVDSLAAKCTVKNAQGKKVHEMVLLIDEYDKPLLGHLCKDDVIEYRDALKEFYSVIKTTESKQRFAFITGVSKFSKVSIFSDLNNLTDLTMAKSTAELFGYTHEEVKRYYPKMISTLGEKYGWTPEQTFAMICRKYDGYRFCENGECMINPVSLGFCFREQKFDNYWSKTAQPTFLMEILKKHPLNFRTIGLTAEMLDAYEPQNPQIETLLYQTGYLTIKGVDYIGRDLTAIPPRIGTARYELAFPNREVSDSFVSRLVPLYTGTEQVASDNAQAAAGKAILADDVQGFIEALEIFFYSIPYNLTDRQNEQMWQTIVWTVLKGVGINVDGEIYTAKGRADMVIRTAKNVYILEFKLNDTAANAIKQIRKLKYHKPYEITKKGITLIGLGFSAKKRTITSKKVVVYRKSKILN